MKKERMADIKIRVKIVKKEYFLDAQQHIGKEYDVYNIMLSIPDICTNKVCVIYF